MTGNNQRHMQGISLHNNIQTPLLGRDQELYDLVKASGITVGPHLYRVLLELLKLDVSPTALFDVLQNMATQPAPFIFVQRKNTQNKTPEIVPVSDKKKPPVAAKPKKIRV